MLPARGKDPIKKKKEDTRRFKVSLLIGAYGTQIDGDNYNGYDKLGLSLGLRATAIINKHFEGNMEFLYQEKGSVFETYVGGDKDRDIHLIYVEVPFLMRYFFSEKKLGVNLEAGVAYSKLVRSKISEPLAEWSVSYEAIALDFVGNETSLIFGAAYQFTKNLSAGGRYSFSVKRFYDEPEGVVSESYNPNGIGEKVTYLRNYFIGGYAAYTF